MKTETTTSPSMAWLILPLLLSGAPWIVTLVLLNHAPLEYAEGALMLGGLIGGLSFAVTGPTTGITLSVLMRRKAIDMWGFLGLFFLTSIPVLSFEAFATSSSLMGIFGPSHTDNLREIIAYHAVCATAIYGLLAVLLYWLAKKGVGTAITGAVLFCCAGFALLARALFI